MSVREKETIARAEDASSRRSSSGSRYSKLSRFGSADDFEFHRVAKMVAKNPLKDDDFSDHYSSASIFNSSNGNNYSAQPVGENPYNSLLPSALHSLTFDNSFGISESMLDPKTQELITPSKALLNSSEAPISPMSSMARFNPFSHSLSSFNPFTMSISMKMMNKKDDGRKFSNELQRLDDLLEDNSLPESNLTSYSTPKTKRRQPVTKHLAESMPKHQFPSSNVRQSKRQRAPGYRRRLVEHDSLLKHLDLDLSPSPVPARSVPIVAATNQSNGLPHLNDLMLESASTEALNLPLKNQPVKKRKRKGDLEKSKGKNAKGKAGNASMNDKAKEKDAKTGKTVQVQFTGQWAVSEEAILLRLTTGMIQCELKTIAEAAQKCGIERGVRAIDKKLKRLIDFKSWKDRNPEQVVEKVAKLMLRDVEGYKLKPDKMEQIEKTIKEFTSVGVLGSGERK